MTREEKHELLVPLKAQVLENPDHSKLTEDITRVLRTIVPMLPFKSKVRANRQRVVFAWDGWHVVADKIVPQSPPATPDEVREALMGLLEDTEEMITL